MSGAVTTSIIAEFADDSGRETICDGDLLAVAWSSCELVRDSGRSVVLAVAVYVPDTFASPIDIAPRTGHLLALCHRLSVWVR